MRVQVTSHSADTYGLAVVERSNEKIVVKELKGGKGNFNFNYFVTTVCAGFEEHQPVVANTHFKPGENETIDDFEKRYNKDDMSTKAMRDMLISNGILTNDGHINMAMINKMGWTVADGKLNNPYIDDGLAISKLTDLK